MPQTNTSNSATPTTGASANNNTPGTAGAKPSILTNVANFFRPNFGKDGVTPRRGSRTMRSMMGMFAFVIIAEILLTVVTLAASAFGLQGALTQPLAPGVTWLNWELVIFGVMVLALWTVFNRMGWFPKPEPLPASSRGSTSSANGKKKVTQIPGIGGPKARTVTPVVRTTTTSPAPVKPSYFARLTGQGANKAAKTAPATAAKATSAAAPTASDNGEYDKAYERVKAAQRLKRRRSLR
jgi:hypothetical protein